MGQVIDICFVSNLLRLVIIDQKGNVVYDKYLSRTGLKSKLKSLKCTYTKESYHIKICKGDKIVLNRLFFPSTSDEKLILDKVEQSRLLS